MNNIYIIEHGYTNIYGDKYDSKFAYLNKKDFLDSYNRITEDFKDKDKFIKSYLKVYKVNYSEENNITEKLKEILE